MYKSEAYVYSIYTLIPCFTLKKKNAPGQLPPANDSDGAFAADGVLPYVLHATLFEAASVADPIPLRPPPPAS